MSRIGSFAFEKSAVTRVEIPEGVTAIGRFAFSECRDLASLTLPESLTSLGDCALMLCTSLHTLSIPEGLTEVGSNPFCYCTGLTELLGLEDHPALLFLDSAVLPESVKTVEDLVFFHCTALQTVEFPASVEFIGDACFAQCIAVRMIAPEGSYAWQWAQLNGMSVLAPEAEEPDEPENPDNPQESEDAG